MKGTIWSMRLFAPVVAAAALLVVAGCASEGDPRAEPAPSNPSTSQTVTTTPTPTPAATVSATPAGARQLRPAVELRVPEGSTYLGRAGRLHLTASPQGVLAQRPDGSEAWRLRTPKGTDPYDGRAWLHSGAGVVVHSVTTTFDPWPGRVLVQAVDADSGDVLWREVRASFANAGEGLVFTSHCTGQQDAQIGDCTLRARDARSGETRWAIPTYASVMVDEVGAEALVVESHPHGAEASMQVLSTATGAALSVALSGDTLTVLDDGFLRIGPPDQRPRDGCRVSAQGLDLAGTVLWTRSFDVGRDKIVKKECGNLYGDALGTSGPVTVRPFEGVMRVLDPGSGETIWAGEEGEEARLISHGVLVAVQAAGGLDSTSRVVDLSSGKELWTSGADALSTDRVSWTALGRHLLRTDVHCWDACRAKVVRARTGETVRELSGEHALTGPGWVATFTDERYNRVQVFELG